MSEKVLMKGNEAICVGAIKAGCRHYFGYPITPQTEIPEYMAKEMPKIGGVFVQAESEVAAINMVFGAAGAGARAMTTSSSPGMSLKQEGISYLAAAQLPCVLVNIVRGGPGLGGIQPAQSDYFQATKGGGHGDYRNIVLAPASVQEMMDITVLAFELADKYRNPVMILGDGALGQMMEPVEDKPIEIKTYEKPWALTGTQGRADTNIINTLFLNAEQVEQLNNSLQKKYAIVAENEKRWEEIYTEDAELVIVAYGITARIAYSAVEQARANGLKVGLLRPISLWPFPDEPFERLSKTTNAFLTLELSAGQMIEDVKLASQCRKPVYFKGRTGGMLLTPSDVYDEIVKLLHGKEEEN